MLTIQHLMIIYNFSIIKVHSRIISYDKISFKGLFNEISSFTHENA